MKLVRNIYHNAHSPFILFLNVDMLSHSSISSLFLHFSGYSIFWVPPVLPILFRFIITQNVCVLRGWRELYGKARDGNAKHSKSQFEGVEGEEEVKSYKAESALHGGILSRTVGICIRKSSKLLITFQKEIEEYLQIHPHDSISVPRKESWHIYKKCYCATSWNFLVSASFQCTLYFFFLFFGAFGT